MRQSPLSSFKPFPLRLLFAAALTAVTLLACDKVPVLPSLEGGEGKAVRMVVVNEGLFTTNTAALSVIYEDGEVLFDVFRWVNRRPLGDVAQSVTMLGGLYFVAVNNSRRVEILDPVTFESVGNIRYRESGSPRFIAPLTDSTAFVSDLLGQLVVIRTKPPYTDLEYLQLPLKPAYIEKMTTVGGKVFGAYIGKGIAVFDCDDYSVRRMRLIEEVVPTEVTKTCIMPEDAAGRLWVLTYPERRAEQTRLTLHCIDPATEKVVRRVEVPFETKAEEIRKGDIVGMPNYNRLDINGARNLIYFNLLTASEEGTAERPTQTVYTLDTDTGEIAKYLELPGVSMMYGFGVSPEGEVCICDCLDYTAQRGYVRVYRPGEGEAEKFRVGVYPRMILFPGKMQ